MIFAPTVILLHECGHYIAAAAFGLRAYFHSSETAIRMPPHTPPHVLRLIAGAGPAVETALTIGGFYWLWRLRRNRRESSVTLTDWFATFLILCGARWLRCLAGTPAHPLPSDEAFLSGSLGFPPWLLSYLFAPVGLAIIIAAIRLHPRGNRLVPFVSAFLGMAVGGFVWLKIIGPHILP